jgi:NADH dehydrogenase FAD-containing subunit
MFAAYLKINNTPSPTKADIKEFALKQQLGTIFVLVNKTLYILDSLSMKTIDKVYLEIENEDIKVPFYSNIEKIEKSFWSFKEDKIKDYNKYYKTILGL